MSDTAPKITISADPPKRGPGRPRKEDAAPRPVVASSTATPADVKKALATLDSAYNLVATGLVVMGLDRSANEWVDSAEQLKKTNEDALKASPKLAKAIASTGSTGGSLTFMVTHSMAVFGLFRVVQSELQDRAMTREAAAANAQAAADNSAPL